MRSGGNCCPLRLRWWSWWRRMFERERGRGMFDAGSGADVGEC